MMADYVLSVARVRGWPCFPVRANKRPFTDHGFKDASRDESQIAAWWRTWPDAGAAVPTGRASGIWVLDIDPGKGGMYSLGDLELEHQPLPDTLRVRTGGGGRHYYFRWPLDRAVRNKNAFRPGIDVRGEGGYVVIPPSLHESGHRYAFEIDEADILDAPEWLLDLVAPREFGGANGEARPIPNGRKIIVRHPKAYGKAALDQATHDVSSAHEGSRNHTLNAAAYSLRKAIELGYVKRDDVERELQQAAERAGLNAGEARKTIASGLGDVQEPNDPPPPDPIEGETIEGPTVLASSEPLRVAEWVARIFQDDDERLVLRRWRGDWWVYEAGAYRVLPAEEFEAELWRALDKLYCVGKDGPKRYAPSISKITGVMRALLGVEGLLIDETAEPPIWVGGDGDVPRDVMVARNGILDLSTEALLPLTPDLFATNVITTPWDPLAGEPQRWHEFLASIFGDDIEARDLLQDFMGYCLTPDTSQQKLLFIVGPPRSGKGTIGRVLTRLIGERNVASPTLTGLTERFGLAPLLGRPVGIISDARLFGQANQSVIVERILSITGEDYLMVDRKNREPVNVRLPTRLFVMSNELPKLPDSSGALASRMMFLQLQRSFYGAEDTALESRLLEELPGILRWAVRGWQRLKARGAFRSPSSSQEATEDMEALSSPVSVFVDDSCELDPEEWIECQTLYVQWAEWCRENGYHPGTTASFSRALKAAKSRIKTIRVQVKGKRTRRFIGISRKRAS